MLLWQFPTRFSRKGIFARRERAFGVVETAVFPEEHDEDVTLWQRAKNRRTLLENKHNVPRAPQRFLPTKFCEDNLPMCRSDLDVVRIDCARIVHGFTVFVDKACCEGPRQPAKEPRHDDGERARVHIAW